MNDKKDEDVEHVEIKRNEDTEAYINQALERIIPKLKGCAKFGTISLDAALFREPQYRINESKTANTDEEMKFHIAEIQSILKAVAENTSCAHLKASRIQLEDSDGIAVSLLLRESKSIRSLDLQCNRLGPMTLVALSSVMPMNLTLRSLVLDYNDLSSGGKGSPEFSCFIRSIERNNGLESLSLASCSLTDESAVEIIECLKVNLSLTCINLSLNRISLENRMIIRSLCLRNTDLKTACDADNAIERRNTVEADNDSKKYLHYLAEIRSLCEVTHQELLSDIFLLSSNM